MRRSCPACGSARSRRIWSIREFGWRRCRACAGIWVENPPAVERLGSLYADRTYFENPGFGRAGGYHGYLEYLADRDQIERKFAIVLAQVEAQVEPGVLLDVGAGPGLMVTAARARGWHASGLEPNRWAVGYARDELGVDVRRGTLPDPETGAASLDAVTMMDLVEHLPDPAALVAEAARVLRPGGVLAVLTPDAGSWTSRALGRRWPEAIRAPEHLVLFSVAGLTALLESHGFEVIGSHSIGKTSSLATLLADVAPVAPQLARRAERAISAARLDRLTVSFDPRTKFCLYARRPFDALDRGAAAPRRPPRLPTRVASAPPPESVIRDLRELAKARRLAAWMFSRFESALGATAAEVGAGIGTFSDRLLDGGVERLLLIEPEPACADFLAGRYANDRRVEVSAERLPGCAALRGGAGSFDLVLCQNVLEHIDDDAGAVAEMAAALRPGGTLALLVPAHPRLFGNLDLAYGHRRRYTRERIGRLFAAAGLVSRRIESFNLLGIPGWWLSNRLGRGGIDPRALRAYEAALGFWRPIEDRRAPRWGLSLVALGERRQ